MNKIFAIIMSFQLILAPVAFAQQAATGTDAYNETGKGSDEGNTQFMNSLMMTGSGVIGSTLVMCTNESYTFSHYIFAAGALVLLMGEIAAAIKQQDQIKNSKDRAENLKKTKNSQLDAMLLAQNEEMQKRDALEARMAWMTAAEVVYWLAVAGAAVETVLYAFKTYTGYDNWGLTCKNDKNQEAITMGIAGAYGVVGGLTKTNSEGKTDVMGGVMGGVMSAVGAMMLLNQLIKIQGKSMNEVVNTAPGRAIIFGVFAALAEVARSGYKKRRDKANENIAAQQKAIDAWKAENMPASEIAQGSTTPEDEVKTADPKKPSIKLLSKNFKTGHCVGASMVPSSKSCAKPVTFRRNEVKFKSSFLNGASNQAFDMAEAFARDDMGAASVSAAGLASNAARVKAEALALVKEANAERVKKGEKPIDFEKEVKSQLASMSKSAMDASGLKSSGASGNVATLDKETPAADAGTPAVTAAIVPVAAEEPAPDLSLLSGNEEVVDESAVAASGSDQSLDDFESSEQDVSKKPEVSIFKQLSNRYILNYTKIFDRKKTPEVVPEEPKKN